MTLQNRSREHRAPSSHKHKPKNKQTTTRIHAVKQANAERTDMAANEKNFWERDTVELLNKGELFNAREIIMARVY